MVKKKKTAIVRGTKMQSKNKRGGTELSLPSVDKTAQKVATARSKADILSVLAECSGLSKKQVTRIFDNLANLIGMDLGKKGPGMFNIPGLMKLVRITKPATKARKGINPFTKEPMTFKAKPARKAIKIRPLKRLKAMVDF